MSRLGNNPLFEAEKELTQTEPPTVRGQVGRPRNENIIRDNSSQEGLTAEWTRATFIVRCDQLEKLKDFAYTKRVSLKKAMEVALDSFLKDKNDLLSHKDGGEL